MTNYPAGMACFVVS